MKFASLKYAVCRLATAVALWHGVTLSAQQILLAPAPIIGQTLVEHMNAQLSSHTNGAVTDEFTGPTDGSNFFSRPPTNQPNFWLVGVTNIFAQSQFRFAGGMMSSADYLTPVSAHLCVTANHVGGGDGSTNVWLLPDGSYYTNVVITSAQVGSTDIRISLMIKTNWTVCRVFPDAISKIPFWRNPNPALFPSPVFVRFHQGIGRTNEFHSSFVSGSSMPGVLYHQYGQLDFGDYSLGDEWVPGDSSGAAYAIINNEAVLLGTAFSAGYAEPLGIQADAVNAVMAQLCASNGLPAESLTLYDLSKFPDL
jgi:hypothetical protein